MSIIEEQKTRLGDSVPLELLNQISDHKAAAELTEQVIRGEMTESEWHEAVQPLSHAFDSGQVVNIEVKAYAAGDVKGDVVGGDKAGGDVVGRDKTIQAGTYIERATFVTSSPEIAIADEAPAPGKSPFKGLEYFDEADVDLFFGREQLTAKLVGHLHEHRFLAVVGASGSGKSSLVRAGLIPALKHGNSLADGTFPPDESKHWALHVITPAAHPLKELAASLTRDSPSVDETRVLMDDLAKDPRNLDLAIHKILSRTSDKRLLLVVDQFEEVFTLCQDETERKAFVDNLITAALEPNGPTIVVITLRADFYAHCSQYEQLREALANWQAYIGPMNKAELRRAIEEPARRGGWEFELGLVELLLRDTGDEPGALPLLSHALLETWKQRQGRILTLAGYNQAGGVHGAIAKTAESVFNQRLTVDQQAIARKIFMQLTELGEGTQDTRRHAMMSELASDPETTPVVEAVVQILADARLITTGQDTVDVAHEALIREWFRLRDWLDENREVLRLHRRLGDAAREWINNNRDPSYLYQGRRLADVEKWRQIHKPTLSKDEQAFLSESRKVQHNIWRVAGNSALGGATGGLVGSIIFRIADGDDIAQLIGGTLVSILFGGLFGFVIGLGIALGRLPGKHTTYLSIMGSIIAGVLSGLLISFVFGASAVIVLISIIIGGLYGGSIALSLFIGRHLGRIKRALVWATVATVIGGIAGGAFQDPIFGAFATFGIINAISLIDERA